MHLFYPRYHAQSFYRNTFLVDKPQQIARAEKSDREWNNLAESGCHFTCLAMIAGVDPALLALPSEASARGVIIVNLSQCLHGKVNMGGYATGNALSRAGVISGFDMTAEAALTKLHFLLSQDLPAPRIRELMQQSLRGELTP